MAENRYRGKFHEGYPKERKRLRIAWFSELRGEDSDLESISAYCSEMLLPYLREEFEIELFHDSFKTYKDYPTHHFLTAASIHEKNPFDLFFYQLEDKPKADFCRAHLGVIPGIVWFHDIMFTPGRMVPFGNSPWRNTLKQIFNDKHPFVDRDAKFDNSGWEAKREYAMSAVSIFSDSASLGRFAELQDIKLSRGFELYLPIPVDVPKMKGKSLSKFFRIASAAKPYNEYQSFKLLDALSALEFPWKLTWLIAEEERELAEDLAKQFFGEGYLEKIVIVDGRSPRLWQSVLQDTDLAVHLLHSSVVNREPYLTLSLANLVPVLMNRDENLSFIPDTFTFQVDTGIGETAQIREALKAIYENSRTLRIQTKQRDYALDQFDTERIASELISLFKVKGRQLRGLYYNWGRLENRARGALLDEISTKEESEMWQKSFLPVMQELGWSK